MAASTLRRRAALPDQATPTSSHPPAPAGRVVVGAPNRWSVFDARFEAAPVLRPRPWRGFGGARSAGTAATSDQVLLEPFAGIRVRNIYAPAVVQEKHPSSTWRRFGAGTPDRSGRGHAHQPPRCTLGGCRVAGATRPSTDLRRELDRPAAHNTGTWTAGGPGRVNTDVLPPKPLMRVRQRRTGAARTGVRAAKASARRREPPRRRHGWHRGLARPQAQHSPSSACCCPSSPCNRRLAGPAAWAYAPAPAWSTSGDLMVAPPSRTSTRSARRPGHCWRQYGPRAPGHLRWIRWAPC